MAEGTNLVANGDFRLYYPYQQGDYQQYYQQHYYHFHQYYPNQQYYYYHQSQITPPSFDSLHPKTQQTQSALDEVEIRWKALQLKYSSTQQHTQDEVEKRWKALQLKYCPTQSETQIQDADEDEFGEKMSHSSVAELEKKCVEGWTTGKAMTQEIDELVGEKNERERRIGSLVDEKSLVENDLSEAHELFDKISHKSCVSYTSILMGLTWEFSLSGNALKTLGRSITCLARIRNELIIQASPPQLTFHTLNSSNVLLKAVCAVLRTLIAGIDHLSVLLPDHDAPKVRGTLDYLNGLLSVDFEDVSDSSHDLLAYGWAINTKYYTADISVWMAHIQDEFSIASLPIYEKLDALVMVFDMSDLSSFDALKELAPRTDIQKFDILLCICNKADLLPGHPAHVEYRRRSLKLEESSGYFSPKLSEYGISKTDESSLLGDEEPSLEIKRSCLEWCIDQNIEFIEACASNVVFDKCLSVDGDSQGVERLYGALTAYMWPGMVLKYGDKIIEPSLPEQEELLEEVDGTLEPNEDKTYDFEDLEQLMYEIGNIRNNLRLMPDF